MLTQEQVRMVSYKQSAIYKFAQDWLGTLRVDRTLQVSLDGLTEEQKMMLIVNINADGRRPRGLINVGLNEDKRFLRVRLIPGGVPVQ